MNGVRKSPQASMNANRAAAPTPGRQRQDDPDRAPEAPAPSTQAASSSSTGHGVEEALHQPQRERQLLGRQDEDQPVVRVHEPELWAMR